MADPAGSLGCPRCGAPAAPEALRCAHCGSTLALVACPACFGRIFQGARFCSHCGAEAARQEARGGRAALHCPRCREALAPVRVGTALLDECARCGGVWAERADLERILKDGEARASVLGAAGPHTGEAAAQAYVPCPDCARLMNRVNFARCSGVIVDVCKPHGTWFDRDELQRLVDFVRGGGLARARQHELEDLAEERARLREQEARLHARQAAGGPSAGFSGAAPAARLHVFDLADAVASAGSALHELFGD